MTTTTTPQITRTTDQRGPRIVTRQPDVFNTAPHAPSFVSLALPLVRRLLAQMAEQD